MGASLAGALGRPRAGRPRRVEVLVEYQLPLTSKRADVVLCGEHPRPGGPRTSSSSSSSGRRPTSSRAPPTSQPSTDWARGSIPSPRSAATASTCATSWRRPTPPPTASPVSPTCTTPPTDVAELCGYPQDEHGRLFTGQRRGEFLGYLRSRLSPPTPASTLPPAAGSAVRRASSSWRSPPRRSSSREQFVLLDEQRVAYSPGPARGREGADRATTRKSSSSPAARAAGKSVIALSLLGELSRRAALSLHATGSRSFTQTLRKVAGARAPRSQGPVQVLQPVHRRRAATASTSSSATRPTASARHRPTGTRRRAAQPADAQVDELIDAARVPVFLLDENQVVRPGEMGTVEDIDEAARERGLDVHRIDLDAQFRCGGSAAYVEWVQRLLGLEPGGPMPGRATSAFDVRRSRHRRRRWRRRSRAARRATTAPASPPATAGRGATPLRTARSCPTSRSATGSRRGTTRETSRRRCAPAAVLGQRPGGFDQVGCVYTAQGFEYDCAGVIFGPDLVWRNDRWVSQPSQSHDSLVKRGAAQDSTGRSEHLQGAADAWDARGGRLLDRPRDTTATRVAGSGWLVEAQNVPVGAVAGTAAKGDN